jgi:DNA-binding transcriptional LysR family regulator
MLETSHLRCFVIVAEELHFGRAAARLNMTQPPLSRQIQLLERALKCELFLRNSRSVQLTHAGANFLPEAQRILRLMEQASVATQAVAGGRRGTARCGFTAAAAYEFLPNLIRTLKERVPEARLALREMVSGAQLAALDSGEIDIGLTRGPVDIKIYHQRAVWRERLVVALPKGHSLASRRTIAWRDLHAQDFLMYESREGRYFHTLISSRLALEDIHPTVVQQLSQIHSILSLVRAGVGIAVVPASAMIMNFSDVEFREFGDRNVLTAELLAVWHHENRNPLVPTIAEIALASGNVGD